MTSCLLVSSICHDFSSIYGHKKICFIIFQEHLGSKDSLIYMVGMLVDTTPTCGVELLLLASGMNGLRMTLCPGRRVRDTDRHFLDMAEGGTPGN